MITTATDLDSQTQKCIICTNIIIAQVENKLNKLVGAIYPVMQETATFDLFELQLVLRHVPRRQLVSIIKSYFRADSEEFNKKK